MNLYNDIVKEILTNQKIDDKIFFRSESDTIYDVDIKKKKKKKKFLRIFHFSHMIDALSDQFIFHFILYHLLIFNLINPLII